jgi:glyoxylate/succinic semialdehyde reductase
MKIGFIGLGIMGSRMAKNLLKNKVDLAIGNRSKEKAEELINMGARWFDDPQELAANCDVLFSMLSTPEVVEELAFGKNGFVFSMNKNSIWVDCTTVNPSFSKRMDEKANELGIRFLDAPVAGSLVPAEKGELVFLVGGEKKDFDEVLFLLAHMGKTSKYMGGCGSGASTKMVVNSMLGQAMVAFSEGVSLGKSLGISQDKLFDLLVGGPIASPFISLKKNKIETGDYSPEFPLKWMHKDLFLATQSAYENDCVVPSLNAAKDLYGSAKANGMADQDMSAIFKYINEGLKG